MKMLMLYGTVVMRERIVVLEGAKGAGDFSIGFPSMEVRLTEPKLAVARPVVWYRVVISLPAAGTERRSVGDRYCKRMWYRNTSAMSTEAERAAISDWYRYRSGTARRVTEERLASSPATEVVVRRRLKPERSGKVERREVMLIADVAKGRRRQIRKSTGVKWRNWRKCCCIFVDSCAAAASLSHLKCECERVRWETERETERERRWGRRRCGGAYCFLSDLIK